MNDEISAISVEKLKTGDRESFARFVDETSGRAYRTVLQILGNEQDAEDVLQDTYMKAYRALPDFENRSSLATWLHRIAVNEALMVIRNRKPQMISVDDNQPFDAETEGEEMEIADFCCLPEAELLSNESRQFLDQAVQNLPEQLRVVFVMRDIEGLSIRETAEALGISENNVKIRLMRARLNLRHKLSKHFNKELVEGNRS
jgi:RNA polymerase sigma-70 factor (ECF subfamily)